MMMQPPTGAPTMENQAAGMDPQAMMRRQMMMQMLQRQGAAGGQGNASMVGAGSSAIMGLLPLLLGQGGAAGGMKGPAAMGAAPMPPGPNGMMTGGV
jgi:hypothetical protein